MKLTIYRGTREIGGSCVEIATDRARIILDVGLPLQPLDSKSPPVVDSSILPKVKGVFGDKPCVAAILLSHAHADHSGLLERSDASIPIHLSEGTSKMLHAGAIFAGQREIPKERQCTLVPSKTSVIGDIRITPYSVDHSAFDSLAFLIEADGRRLLYSGDLRLHGRKPGMAARLIRAARLPRLDVMIMEGTHFGSDRARGVTEKELEADICARMKGTTGLALASFSPQHVDRLVTFIKASLKAGRTLVLDVYAAYVMYLLHRQCRIPDPRKSASRLRVYYNQSFEKMWRRRRLGKIHGFFLDTRISIEEILAQPQKHCMVFRPSMLAPDFGGRLPQGALCLYSFWSGYLQKPDWRHLRTKLKEAKGEFAECHTSGHIFADDIVEFVNRINPRGVVPIHTFHSERFETCFANAILLQDGQTFPIA